MAAARIVLLARLDWRLAVPIALWFALYAALLRLFVPRLRERSRRMSEVRSALTGRVVDSYTNILTVKLFARARDEDAFVREAMDEHTVAFRDQTRLITAMTVTLALMNALLLVGTGAVAIWQWRRAHRRRRGGDRAAAGLADLQHGRLGGRSVTGIFENVGVVQDGMRSIAVPRQMPDPPAPASCDVAGGGIRFEQRPLRLRHATPAACCTAST